MGTTTRCGNESKPVSDGKTCTYMGQLRLLDADTGAVLSLKAAHPDFSRCLAWHPGGLRLASGSGNTGTVKIWEQPDLRLHRTVEGQGRLYGLSYGAVYLLRPAEAGGQPRIE